MGIKELNPFLKQFANSCVKQTDLSKFSGKKIAIDTSIYLYKYLYGNDKLFIDKFLQQILRLRQNNITPIYIFDGKPPKEKEDEILTRQNRKKNLKDKLNNLKEKCLNTEDVDEKAKLEKEIKKSESKIINVTKKHIESLKYLLDLMNIKYIHSDCEADYVCSYLSKNNKVDLVLSDDMDLLVSGTQILIRNFSINSNIITEYNLNEILEKLDITYEQWVDFCILCGCDYSKRIRGMGPIFSYKFIKQYGNIENLLKNVMDNQTKYTIPNSFNYIRARNLFNSNLHYTNSDINLNMEELYDNQLINIKNHLVKHTRFNNQQIINKLNVIYNLKT